MIQIFEAKGSGAQFECNVKGILRFGLKLKDIKIQPSTSLLFIETDKNTVIYLPYNSKAILQSVLTLDSDTIVAQNSYSLNDFSISSTIDKYVLV